MTSDEMKIELQRQLDSGEATRADYEGAVQNCETEMALMHAHADYDVGRYMMLKASSNVYREFLGLAPSTVSDRATVPANLSDDEYKTRIATQLPESTTASEPRERSCWECGGQVRNGVCTRCYENQSDNWLN